MTVLSYKTDYQIVGEEEIKRQIKSDISIQAKGLGHFGDGEVQ